VRSRLALDRGVVHKVVPSLILSAPAEALPGISSYAVTIGPSGGVSIEGSQHAPVGAHLVPELVRGPVCSVNDPLEEVTLFILPPIM